MDNVLRELNTRLLENELNRILSCIDCRRDDYSKSELAIIKDILGGLLVQAGKIRLSYPIKKSKDEENRYKLELSLILKHINPYEMNIEKRKRLLELVLEYGGGLSVDEIEEIQTSYKIYNLIELDKYLSDIEYALDY